MVQVYLFTYNVVVNTGLCIKLVVLKASLNIAITEKSKSRAERVRLIVAEDSINER